MTNRANSATAAEAIPSARQLKGRSSRTHARLECTAHGVWVLDNGSTNGTELVDEQGAATRVPPGARTAVEDGTRLRLGERIVTLARMTGSTP